MVTFGRGGGQRETKEPMLVCPRGYLQTAPCKRLSQGAQKTTCKCSFFWSRQQGSEFAFIVFLSLPL